MKVFIYFQQVFLITAEDFPRLFFVLLGIFTHESYVIVKFGGGIDRIFYADPCLRMIIPENLTRLPGGAVFADKEHCHDI
ncbi:MAG: hypothetical protein GX827_06095 [Clostridiales bacterium]|nr:hypothetical protein [Clostridiales bacterium]